MPRRGAADSSAAYDEDESVTRYVVGLKGAGNRHVKLQRAQKGTDHFQSNIKLTTKAMSNEVKTAQSSQFLAMVDLPPDGNTDDYVEGRLLRGDFSHLAELFQLADTKKRNALTLEEFVGAFGSLIDAQGVLGAEGLSVLFHKIDQDQNGTVDFSELMAYAYSDMESAMDGVPYNEEDKYTMGHIQTRTPHHNTIVRILPHVGRDRYLSASRDGVLALWDQDLKRAILSKKHKISLFDTLSNEARSAALLDTAEGDKRAARTNASPLKRTKETWIVDAAYLPASKHVAIASDNYKLCFYRLDENPLGLNPDFVLEGGSFFSAPSPGKSARSIDDGPGRLINLEYATTCMDGGAAGGDKSVLVLGDAGGCVTAYVIDDADVTEHGLATAFNPIAIHEGRVATRMYRHALLSADAMGRGAPSKFTAGGPVEGQWVPKVMFMPDMDSVATCSTNSARSLLVTPLDPSSGVGRRVWRIPPFGVNDFDYCSGDYHLLATAGIDRTVRLWKPLFVQSRPVSMFIGHSNPITHVRLAADKHQMITVSSDKTVKLWDLRRPGHLAIQTFVVSPDEPLVPENHLTAVHFDSSPAHPQVILAAQHMHVWPAYRPPETVENRVQSHRCPVVGAVYEPHLNAVISVSRDDAQVMVWDLDTGASKSRFTAIDVSHERERAPEITSAAIAGRRLVTGNAGGGVSVWNVWSGQLIKKLYTEDGGTEPIASVKFIRRRRDAEIAEELRTGRIRLGNEPPLAVSRFALPSDEPQAAIGFFLSVGWSKTLSLWRDTSLESDTNSSTNHYAITSELGPAEGIASPEPELDDDEALTPQARSNLIDDVQTPRKLRQLGAVEPSPGVNNSAEIVSPAAPLLAPATGVSPSAVHAEPKESLHNSLLQRLTLAPPLSPRAPSTPGSNASPRQERTMGRPLVSPSPRSRRSSIARRDSNAAIPIEETDAIPTPVKPDEDMMCVTFTHPNVVVTAAYDGKIMVWTLGSFQPKLTLMPRDLRHRLQMGEIQKETCTIWKLLFLELKRTNPHDTPPLVSCGEDGTVRFWDLSRKREVFRLVTARRGDAVTCAVADSENKFLYTGHSNGKILVFNIAKFSLTPQNGSFVGTARDTGIEFKAHGDNITSMEYIWDSLNEHRRDLLLTAGNDMTVRLYKVSHSTTGNILAISLVGIFSADARWNVADPDTHLIRNVLLTRGTADMTTTGSAPYEEASDEEPDPDADVHATVDLKGIGRLNDSGGVTATATAMAAKDKDFPSQPESAAERKQRVANRWVSGVRKLTNVSAAAESFKPNTARPVKLPIIPSVSESLTSTRFPAVHVQTISRHYPIGGDTDSTCYQHAAMVEVDPLFKAHMDGIYQARWDPDELQRQLFGKLPRGTMKTPKQRDSPTRRGHSLSPARDMRSKQSMRRSDSFVFPWWAVRLTPHAERADDIPPPDALDTSLADLAADEAHADEEARRVGQSLASAHDDDYGLQLGGSGAAGLAGGQGAGGEVPAERINVTARLPSVTPPHSPVGGSVQSTPRQPRRAPEGLLSPRVLRGEAAGSEATHSSPTESRISRTTNRSRFTAASRAATLPNILPLPSPPGPPGRMARPTRAQFNRYRPLQVPMMSDALGAEFQSRVKSTPRFY